MANQDRASESYLPIGAVARAAAVNVETIRYYQRRGLVSEPRKPFGGHRRYESSAVERVLFIKRAQELGFTLKEIRDLARIHDSMSAGSETWEQEMVDIARQRLQSIEEKLASLQAMKAQLDAFVAQADGREILVCPASGSRAARTKR